MVEPISLATASVIGGFLIGKFVKKDNEQVEEVMEPEQNLEFIAVEDGIDKKDLLPFIQHNRSSFLNITKVKDVSAFVEFLQEFAVENNYRLNRVSQELLLLIPEAQKIKIRKLVRKEEVFSDHSVNINGS